MDTFDLRDDDSVNNNQQDSIVENGYRFLSKRLWEYDPFAYATQKYWLEFHISPKFRCSICYEYCSSKKIWRDCPNQQNEFFCSDCLKQYIISRIQDGRVNSDNTIACPCATAACSGRIHENVVLSLLGNDPSLMEKFHKFSLNAEVSSSSNKTFCPNRQCGAVVTHTSRWSSSATCQKCSITFCFNCRESHSPWISCSMAGDMEFKKWRSTTQQGCKRCPKCHIYIEKNEGCMHMTCMKCRYEFCWQCLSKWKGSCSAPQPYHATMMILEDDIWGQSLSTRMMRKSIGIPLLCVAGCGVGGVALGVASVAATCFVLATPVAACVYLYRNPPRAIRQLYHRFTGQEPTFTGFEITSILQYGVIISLPWRYDDPHYIHTLQGMRSTDPPRLGRIDYGSLTNSTASMNPTFMGIHGRLFQTIFVGYLNHPSLGSFVAYFIPDECPVETIRELSLQTNEIIRIPFPSNTIPYSDYRENEDSVILQQLYERVRLAVVLG